MIILPDRNIARAKILVPQRWLEWDQPSQRLSKKCIRNQTRFRLTARVNDGAIVWRGWFDDRGDADAFLYAMVTGQLQYERELWRLPTPWWGPDLGEHLSYDFATVTFLTANVGTYQDYPKPSDWSGNNSVECIGGGGSGYTPVSGVVSGSGGGGGGGYSRINGFSFTGSTTRYYVGKQGNAVAYSSESGQASFFGMATDDYNVSAVGASGGGGGGGGAGGAGGQVANGRGTLKYRGGTGSGISSYGGGGGGGAAGPHGDGGGSGAANGINVSGVNNSGGCGGGGGGGGTFSADWGGTSTGTPGGFNWKGTGSGAGSPNSSGAGGTDGGGGGGAGGLWNNSGGPGGNGTDWDATHGSGGGAGGAGTYNSTDGGSGAYGGVYGGGGGGGAYGSSTWGYGYGGGQGIVVVIYTPGFAAFNMPMMGM
jgi:hypothetical protein